MSRWKGDVASNRPIVQTWKRHHHVIEMVFYTLHCLQLASDLCCRITGTAIKALANSSTGHKIYVFFLFCPPRNESRVCVGMVVCMWYEMYVWARAPKYRCGIINPILCHFCPFVVFHAVDGMRVWSYSTTNSTRNGYVCQRHTHYRPTGF